MKRSLRMLAAVAVFAIIAAACSGGGSGGALTIGTDLPQTGDLAVLGPPMVEAVNMAVRDINEAGGVNGDDVVLEVGDSGTNEQLGAPVERGQVLMEVAPLDAYRVAIAVDERDIRYVQIGQTGELILPSVPNSTFSFTVSKITPVATAADGKNTFRIEANLTDPSQALRPGMEGTAKIEAGERRLIWVWTRRFTEWFRVWVWSWWY